MPAPPPAFHAPLALAPARRLARPLSPPRRRRRPALAATPPPPPSPPPRRARRSLVMAAAAAIATVTLSLPAPPPPTEALTLAPTPINPYARRRRERTYKQYVEKLEQTFEAVQVADFKKVVEAGGGGLGLSYRVAGVAAFAASALSTAVVHPLDSLKTRMQAGVRGRMLFDRLYTGLWSNVLKEAPNAAIYLGVYELIKNALVNLSVTSFFHDLPLVTFLVAGALGDAIGSVVRVPAEIVNKRLQLRASEDVRGALSDAFLSSEGRQASVVAWKAVLWRDVPYGGLQIMLYEFGRQMLATHPGAFGGAFADQGVLTDVIVGALAGALAAMATTPADVLVTRLSVQNPQSYLETRKYMDVGSTARRILQDEGVGGFFRGTWQRGVYYAPMIGLFFALYEFNKGWIEHPDMALAMVGAAQHWAAAAWDPLQGAVADEWKRLPGQMAAVYSAASPVMAGFLSAVAQQVPLAFSFASPRV